MSTSASTDDAGRASFRKLQCRICASSSVGFYALYAWTLGRVAVRQEVHGNGLGRKLLHAAIDWIRTNTSAR
ncbi:GNAT family N-acetyltransferase [Rothia dentocariosa]|uniref:GNAT family N-acetyltransferase n=1 Tax=Rothia dentocariosa TaxID=2047 RepID=UPI00352DE640